MNMRSCRVTIRDMEGVSHTVEVTASTLYEAVAQGIAAMRGKEWVDGFPQGTGVLLAAGMERNSRNIHFLRINLTSHNGVDLGATEVSGNVNEIPDVTWGTPGKTVLFSRTVNNLTNLWQYSLEDRILTQITLGAGPDYSPMPDPAGKGIYYVNGKSSGFLSTYHTHSKESTDIVFASTWVKVTNFPDSATSPALSLDSNSELFLLPCPAMKKKHLA